MNENTNCKSCHFPKCCCNNICIINRRHNYLCQTLDLKRMETHFDIVDTDYSKHSISLERRTRFIYSLTIKKTSVYNPLTTYIQGLPRDMNNVIYSYLKETNLIIKILIRLPHDYPFGSTTWTVIKYSRDGKTVNARDETQKVRCIMNPSCAMKLDQEVIQYISTISFQ